MKVFKQFMNNESWNLLTNEENLWLFEVINRKDFHIKNTLKQHHRSTVYHIEISGKEYILKIPSEKNSRKWIRFTTLFRDGEAFKNIQGMLTYQRLGLHSTLPVMAAEKRKKGMVFDSWLLYEYLDGEPCLDKEKYYPLVIKALHRIHDLGYLHSDPQIRNFLYKKGRIYVIDSNPKRAGIFNFDKAYEFAYLRKSAPGIEKYFGPVNSWWLYRVAFYYDIYERKLVRTKRKIKKQLLGK